MFTSIICIAEETRLDKIGRDEMYGIPKRTKLSTVKTIPILWSNILMVKTDIFRGQILQIFLVQQNVFVNLHSIKKFYAQNLFHSKDKILSSTPFHSKVMVKPVPFQQHGQRSLRSWPASCLIAGSWICQFELALTGKHCRDTTSQMI